MWFRQNDFRYYKTSYEIGAIVKTLRHSYCHSYHVLRLEAPKKSVLDRLFHR